MTRQQTMMFIKGPGSDGQGFHQDSYYIPTFPDTLIGAWIAVDRADTVDPLAGSYYVEYLTRRIEDAVMAEIAKIDAMGGALAAIERGYFQRELGRE